MYTAKNVEIVEETYQEYIEVFTKISSCIAKYANTERNFIIDQIKKDLADRTYRKRIFNPSLLEIFKSILKAFFLFYISVIGFILHKRLNNKKYDFLYDTWEKAAPDVYDVYYKHIIENFPKKSHHVVPPIKMKKLLDNFRSTDLNIKLNLIIYFPLDALLLVRKSIFFKVNFIQILNNYAVQSSLLSCQYRNFKSDLFFSAGDVYFGGLKYALIKKYTKSKIFLFQQFISSGGQTSQDNYRTSDYYFVFSKHQVDIMPFLKCKDIIVTGNFPTLEKLKSVDIKSKIIYDIAIVDHYPDDIEELCTAKAFFDLMEMSVKFSKEFPNVKIVYMPRPNRYGFIQAYGADGELKIQKLDSILKQGNFLYDKKLSSLSIIARSDIVITYTSMMWLDTMALGKKILIYNPEKLANRPNDECSPKVLCTNNYEKFKEKLLHLLSQNSNSDDRATDYYYPKIENPYSLIYSKIKEEIEN